MNVTQTSRPAARSRPCAGWTSVAWTALTTPNPAFKQNTRRSALTRKATALPPGISLNSDRWALGIPAGPTLQANMNARCSGASAKGCGISPDGALARVSPPSRPVVGSSAVAALGSAKSVVAHPFSRPTRRCSGSPLAPAELARWVSHIAASVCRS